MLSFAQHKYLIIIIIIIIIKLKDLGSFPKM